MFIREKEPIKLFDAITGDEIKYGLNDSLSINLSSPFYDAYEGLLKSIPDQILIPWTEEILRNYDMYYNKEKSTFVVKDDHKTTVVKKCSEDTEDMEKAMLYALLKHLGIKPKLLNEQLKNVHVYKKKDDKNEKA